MYINRKMTRQVLLSPWVNDMKGEWHIWPSLTFYTASNGNVRWIDFQLSFLVFSLQLSYLWETSK
jgi:hypothetical protein